MWLSMIRRTNGSPYLEKAPFGQEQSDVSIRAPDVMCISREQGNAHTRIRHRFALIPPPRSASKRLLQVDTLHLPLPFFPPTYLNMTYPQQIFTAFSFMGFLVSVIPLPWHLEGAVSYYGGPNHRRLIIA